MSVKAFAYCVVSIVSAAFDAVYSGATTFDSGRDGSWVYASEPMPLLTLMMSGSADRRSSGRNAFVVRTTPARFTSNTASASAPVREPGSPTGPWMPALLISTSTEPSCAATFAAAAVTDASSVTSTGTNRAPSAAAASAPRSASRAPTSTVWPSSTSRRAVSRPSPLFAPVMKVIVMSPVFVRHAAPARDGSTVGTPVPPSPPDDATGWVHDIRRRSRCDDPHLAGPAAAVGRRAAGRQVPPRGRAAPRGARRPRRCVGRLPGPPRTGPGHDAVGAGRRLARPCPATVHSGTGSPVPAGRSRRTGGRLDLRPHPARRAPRAHPSG